MTFQVYKNSIATQFGLRVHNVAKRTEASQPPGFPCLADMGRTLLGRRAGPMRVCLITSLFSHPDPSAVTVVWLDAVSHI